MWRNHHTFVHILTFSPLIPADILDKQFRFQKKEEERDTPYVTGTSRPARSTPTGEFLIAFHEPRAADELGLPSAVPRGRKLEMIRVSLPQAQNTPPGFLMSREK
ncbi:Aspartate/glutamate permease AcaP, partial [Clarias magur]